MKNSNFLMLYSLLLLISASFISNKDNLEFIDDKGSPDNEVVNRKRVEDVLKWLNRINDGLETKKKVSSSLSKDVIDYVNGLERVELIQLAYALEVYHRKVKGLKDLLGGLHDYVFKISDDQIRNFIFKELNEHSEISEKNKIENLLQNSNFQTEELKLYSRDLLIGDGIHDYLKGLDRPSLYKLAFAVEDYHRKIREELLFGGLHDYIDQISEDDLRSYIAKEANEHAEISSVSALENFIKG